MLADMTLRRTNALTMEEDDRVRKAVRKLVADAGSQRALSAALAAKGLRVSQQTINRHLNGDAAGREFAQLVARAVGVTYDELLGRPTPRDDGRPTLDRIPGYAEVEAAARARAPYLPAVAWEKTRAMSGAALADLTPELLVGFASTWAQVAAGRLRELPPDEGAKPPPVTKKR